MEEQVVDINLVANVSFTIVDALMTLERGKSARRSGDVVTNQVRRNMILARVSGSVLVPTTPPSPTPSFPKDMTPKPQRDGWSEPIYFFDDRIDLDAFFNIDVGPAPCPTPLPGSARREQGAGEDRAGVL